MNIIYKMIRGIKRMFALKTSKKENIVSNIKPEWEELCQECSSAAKKAGWTKEDSRKLLKQVRAELRNSETN